jgi:fatty-acyl-CoA synthase
MKSTMQDFPLNVAAIFRHGRSVHSRSQVVTCEGMTSRRATFAAVADRAERLAAALRRLGVRPDDRVATLCWNTQEHLEAYFAVPLMGAVLHTLNLRLFPEQLEYIVNHAEDSIILVDDSLVPLLAKIAPRLKTVRHFIAIGKGDASALGNVLRYEELIAAERPGFEWPEIDERAAAAMCYTSGTTGNPKGIVYSHRSTYLHSMALGMTGSIGLNDSDRVLPIVPMFHVNAWGLPYGGWFAGSDFLFPGRFLQPEPMCAFMQAEKPTVAAGVPTIWFAVLNNAASAKPDVLSSLRTVICGGAAVPRSLIEQFETRFGVRMIQGWGMTETSPLAALARPPADVPPEEHLSWRAMTGRVVPGVEIRIIDFAGREQPWNGEAVGEIEVRGPWVTAAYYRDDSRDRFHDGWLRTGDVGSINDRGFIQITDRVKDVIKSGGEWISSVEIENALMGHPEVLECAVIATPDEKWSERPLACVVRKQGSTLTAEALREFLSGRVAHWAVPEYWTFISEVPKTSVGKFDKKVLRARLSQRELEVIRFSDGGGRKP